MYRMTRRSVGGILALVGCVGLLTSAAFADHNEPKVAKSIKGNVVTAYEPCTAPDTITDSDKGSLLACSVPVRSDPTCGFGTLNGLPKGKGQLQLKSLDDRGWSIKLKLLGLEQPACDGETMTFVVTYRATAHNCGGMACTAADQTVELAHCTVERGVCKINVPTHPLLYDLRAPGGTEVLRFSVTHNSLRAFEIGMLSKMF